jgi:hypothetical protein
MLPCRADRVTLPLLQLTAGIDCKVIQAGTRVTNGRLVAPANARASSPLSDGNAVGIQIRVGPAGRVPAITRASNGVALGA